MTTAPLLHRLSGQLSARLYSIYLYALAQKNNPYGQALAMKRAQLLFLNHARHVLPIVYRTRVKPVIPHAKPLSPQQLDKIVDLKTYMHFFKVILADSSTADLEYIVFHEPNLKETTEEYWKSAMGLKRRIEMLGADFNYHIVNGALQAYGGNPEISGWLGIPGMTEHCEYCIAHIIGHYFRKGQFLPRLPAHRYCSCSWRLIRKDKT